VIPTYKSVNTLKYVLQSIKNQTYDNVEVLVVDRPSADGTKELVEDFGYKYILLDAERTKAVNYGVKHHSRGDFIYYIGSDYVLDRDLVKKAIVTVLEKRVDAAIVPNVIKPSGFWSEVRQLEKETYLGDAMIEAARFFSRKSFLDVGGYDENMVAYEEHDLHNRLIDRGYKISRINGVKEFNIGEPDMLRIYVQKYFYYGQTIGEYFKKYPKQALTQLSPTRLAFFRQWRLFIKNPLLTIGFILYQFVRYYSAGVGYVAGKLKK
jgi:glycosyltransferase involved in cell wall biosynthesis